MEKEAEGGSKSMEPPREAKMPNARICPACRRYFDMDYTKENYKFCPYCGAELVEGTVNLER